MDPIPSVIEWFHPLRRRHVVVRGSRGEVVGTSVTWAGDDGRPLDAPLVRGQTRLDGEPRGRRPRRGEFSIEDMSFVTRKP